MLTARIVDIVKNAVRSIFRFVKNWRRFVRFFLNKNCGVSVNQASDTLMCLKKPSDWSRKKGVKCDKMGLVSLN